MTTIVKLKIKSARMTTELTGGIADAMDSLLIAYDNRQQRETALSALTDLHNRLCDHEDERAKEAATNG